MMRCGLGQGSLADALATGGGNRRLERIGCWMLLEGWYGLSDPAMEEALGGRLSFRRFVGLGPDEAVPDQFTISRFRSLLVARAGGGGVRRGGGAA